MFYKINRFSLIHLILRKFSYSILFCLPFNFKYFLFSLYLKTKSPYKFLNSGDIVVQIGCPLDIIKSGRSRAIIFSKLVGKKGLVYVIEPDKISIEYLNKCIKKYNLKNIIVKKIGAFNKSKKLEFLYDPNNPAANIVSKAFNNKTRNDRSRFFKTVINVKRLDDILPTLNEIKLLSITTNGSEKFILDGAKNIIKKTKYISTISNKLSFFRKNKFTKIYYDDDRGYTFSKPVD